MLQEEVIHLIASVIPAGTIIANASKNIPVGWEICDGREVSKNDPKYRDLYASIGVIWGGDANPNFKLPDLRNRFLRGAKITDNVSKSAGTESHDHGGLTGNCANHPDPWHVGNNRNGAPSAMGTLHQHEIATENHLPPYTDILYLIKL